MKKIVFALLVFFISFNAHSQGEGGGPDPDIPVNQGVVFLLIVGIGFALWHFRKNEIKKFFNEKATRFKQLHRG